MFGSRWSDVKTCSNCSYRSSNPRKETAWFLNISQLPPNSTLDEHIANSFKPQLLIDFSCPDCQQENTVNQNSEIDRGAQQLIVVLCRFEYNRQLQQPQKLTQRVVFGDSLDLTRYSNNMSSPRLQYRLYAVIQHQHQGPPDTHRPRPTVERMAVEGNTVPEWAEEMIQRAEALRPGGSAGIGVSASSGHYRTVMIGPDGHWREIEDSRVDLHATLENAINPAGENWTPYVLLYERLPPSQELEQPSETNNDKDSRERKAENGNDSAKKVKRCRLEKSGGTVVVVGEESGLPKRLPSPQELEQPSGTNNDKDSRKRKAKNGNGSAEKVKRCRLEKPGGTVVVVGEESGLPKRLPPPQELEQPSGTNNDKDSRKRKAKNGNGSAEKVKRCRLENPGGTVVVGEESGLPKKKAHDGWLKRIRARDWQLGQDRYGPILAPGVEATEREKEKRKTEGKKRSPPILSPGAEERGWRVKKAKWWQTIPSSPSSDGNSGNPTADADAGKPTSGEEDEPIVPWRIE